MDTPFFENQLIPTGSSMAMPLVAPCTLIIKLSSPGNALIPTPLNKLFKAEQTHGILYFHIHRSYHFSHHAHFCLHRKYARLEPFTRELLVTPKFKRKMNAISEHAIGEFIIEPTIQDLLIHHPHIRAQKKLSASISNTHAFDISLAQPFAPK